MSFRRMPLFLITIICLCLLSSCTNQKESLKELFPNYESEIDALPNEDIKAIYEVYKSDKSNKFEDIREKAYLTKFNAPDQISEAVHLFRERLGDFTYNWTLEPLYMTSTDDTYGLKGKIFIDGEDSGFELMWMYNRESPYNISAVTFSNNDNPINSKLDKNKIIFLCELVAIANDESVDYSNALDIVFGCGKEAIKYNDYVYKLDIDTSKSLLFMMIPST